MTFWQLGVYALPAIPLSFLYVPLTALLPAFYAQELGLSLGSLGAFLLISRLLDMVIDPLLGRMSDKTRSRFGRRKPWIAAACPIVMIGAFLVFLPPAKTSGWYLLLATSVIYLGASMLGLSHSAWGAEIVESYHGRSKVAGFRETANVLGIVIASAVPAITGLQGHGVDRHTMGLMGWLVISMTPVSAYAALRWIPEPRVIPRPSVPWLATLVSLLANKPFRILCIGYVVLSIGAGITNSTLIFFISQYLGQPAIIGPTLLASFGCVLLGVPFWVQVSRRIGKHRAAGISLLVAALLSGVLVMQLRAGDGWYFVALMALLGATSSAFLTLPLGIMGDVIDYDTLRSGEVRGGLYFGFWAFFQKISPAIAVGATLPFLEFVGFKPRDVNSAAALQALKYVYCLAPLPFYLIGAWMFLHFPLDARRHGIIRRRLEALRGRSADNPGAAVVAPVSEAAPTPAAAVLAAHGGFGKRQCP